MIVYENECVGCPPEMGCLGTACKNRNVPHFYCDECGDETTIYEYEGRELCINCIEGMLDEVKGDEY